jgi:hypothetical protein
MTDATDDQQTIEPEVTEAEKVSEPKPKPKPKPVIKKVEDEPVFTHDRLIRECAQAIGYPSHVVAGAIATAKKTLTINEAKTACEKWLKAQKR